MDSPIPQNQLAQLPTCAAGLSSSILTADPCHVVNGSCTCDMDALRGWVMPLMASCQVEQQLAAIKTLSQICGMPVRDIRVPYLIALPIFLGIATVFKAMRTYARYYQGTQIWWDDVALTLGYIGAAGTTMMAFEITRASGRDIWNVGSEEMTRFFKMFWFGEWIYTFAMAAIKQALLFSFLRIFPNPLFRKLVIASIIFTSLWGVLFGLLFVFQCKPVSFFWHAWKGTEEGMCRHSTPLIWSAAIIAIVSDFFMLTMPIFPLWSLKLVRVKKILVSVMLCIGLFVTVISIVRLHAIARYQHSHNLTYDLVSLSLWSTIEADIGVVCACLPQVRVLLARLFPILSGSSAGRGVSGDIQLNQRGGTGQALSRRHRGPKQEGSGRHSNLRSIVANTSASSVVELVQVEERGGQSGKA